MTLRTLNYGNYGIFLSMGHAGFCPSTVIISTRFGERTHIAIMRPKTSDPKVEPEASKLLRIVVRFGGLKRWDEGR